MKKALFIFSIVILSLNWISVQSSNQENETIPYLDLSHKNLNHIPDLSQKKIKKLNLSNNKITELKIDSLPQGLESLNLSNNELSLIKIEKDKKLKDLKELDISANNKLCDFDIEIPLKRLIIKNNPYINRISGLNVDSLQYFNRLYTPLLDGERFFNKRVQTNPEENFLIPFSKIDTIVSNGEPLEDIWIMRCN